MHVALLVSGAVVGIVPIPIASLDAVGVRVFWLYCPMVYLAALVHLASRTAASVYLAALFTATVAAASPHEGPAWLAKVPGIALLVSRLLRHFR